MMNEICLNLSWFLSIDLSKNWSHQQEESIDLGLFLLTDFLSQLKINENIFYYALIQTVTNVSLLQTFVYMRGKPMCCNDSMTRNWTSAKHYSHQI